jgi:phage-related protein
MEAQFFEWLLSELPEEARAAFAKTLSLIYQRCKQESKSGFSEVERFMTERNGRHTNDSENEV